MRAQSAEGRAWRYALALCAFVFARTLFALDVPPPPNHWFTDRAGLVSADQAAQLDQKLQAFEQQSGAQFIIYTFPSLEGESMEDFTIRCVEKWKVGQKKYDNGLVLFVFAQEKKIRIETGYGLEGTVTDAFSSRVIRDVMAPHFRTSDYYGGLNAAADAVIAKISKGEEPVPPMQQGGDRGQHREVNPLVVMAILFVVFFVILPMLSRRRSGCGGCLPLLFFPGGGSGITFGGGGFSSGGGGWGGGGGGFSGGGGGFGGGGASGGW